MSQDSESIHVKEPTIASHGLVVPGLSPERSRVRSGAALPDCEYFALPGDPPVITEGSRLTRLDLLCSTQPEALATEVLHPTELAQIRRLRSERGYAQADNPTVTALRSWIDDLGGIKPVKLDA